MNAPYLPKSREWIANRATGVGGSDANIIMSGDDEKIYRLWQEKCGFAEPESLDDVLPVVMGNVTEAFNRYWYTQRTGNAVHQPNTDWRHAEHAFMRCEVDGIVHYDAGDYCAIFDAKHVNQFSKFEEVLESYLPQLHHNAACVGSHQKCNAAVLSVFIGTLKYETDEVLIDPFYTAALIEQEAAFWDCVENKREPVLPAPASPPVIPTKTVDMTGNNAWSSAAADWIDNKAASKRFNAAAKSLRGLMPDDAVSASGHGVAITRSKSGKLLIKGEK